MSFRVTAVLLLSILVSVSCYAQSVRFSEKKAPLQDVMETIKTQTQIGYIFMKAADDFRNVQITLPQQEIPLIPFLNSLHLTYHLEFTIDGNIIVINKKRETSPDTTTSQPFQTAITGEVENESGKPLVGATIKLKDSGRSAQTNENGQFELKNVSKGATIIISYNGMRTVERKVEGPGPITVRLTINLMDSVVVGRTNGYQPLPKENKNSVPSIDDIDQPLLDRTITTDILSKLPYIASGVQTNRGGQADDGTSVPGGLQIRGLSTLNADATVLIVVDNFPYEGDIRNINPNDIKNISILKDATATSIWGAQAGNGVIVIVTKKSETAKPLMTYQSSISVQQRPDLWNYHPISSSDYLGFEKYLFDQGYYNNYSNPQNYIPFTSGVDLLQAEKQGLISSTEADARRAVLARLDVRNDMNKYLYRNSINQQHVLQLSTGSGTNRYFLSAGYDHNLSSLAATRYDRFTFRSQNNFQFSPSLRIDAGISFIQTNNQNGDNIQYNYKSPLLNSYIPPYAQLADAQGHALPLNLDYNSNYLQQTRGLGFPNWDFKPLNELTAEINKVRVRDFLLNTGVRYVIFNPLVLEFKYQFEEQATIGKDLHSDSSYYTRDLVNSLIQVDPVTHALHYIIPMGNILDMNNQEMTSNQGRIQLNYNTNWKTSNVLKAIVGYEIRSKVTTGNIDRYYGYDPNGNLVYPGIDYSSTYQQYLTYTPRVVPNPQMVTKLTDNFISYYANTSYSYRSRYRLYGSIRKDEANLFGVATNEKGVPLWSAGMGWELNQEKWYPFKGLPFLNIKATFGVSGNIARQANAATTAASFPGGVSGSTYPMLYIQSPPNKQLRWERVQQLNLAIDFATGKNILSGTLEYYQKHEKDLLALTTADPTLGLVQTPGTPDLFYNNIATMSGDGVDLRIETHNLDRKFKWTTNFLFNYTASKVEKYLNPTGQGNLYLSQNTLNPIKGKPAYSVYSYKTAGLDHQTGDPRVIYRGSPSTEYEFIYNNTGPDSLNFNGPTLPTFSGSLRNNFSLGHLSFSFMLSFRAGNYFRQPSINYYQLALTSKSNSDYAKRWQQPGDEKTTNVPSIHNIFDGLRDNVYLNSSSLVKKADEIRWEDITIGYDLDKTKRNNFPFQHVRLYGTISGLGLIWAANRQGIDPDYINVPKERPRYSLAIALNFSPSNHQK